MKNSFLILLTLITLQLSAQNKYSNAFLNIGVDASALAQGNAVIAQTNNINAGYWNPAGLVNLENSQVSLMHAAYFANIAQYDYMAYAKKINDKTGISISLIRFGVDNIMNTTRLIDDQGNINYDRITYFSTADYALSFSLGRKNLWKGFDVGITSKLIYRHIGSFASGFGFGFDLGAQYHTQKWKFGLMARDITTTFNYWSIDQDELKNITDAIPGKNQEVPNSVELTLPKLQLGVNRSFALKDDLDLSVEMDLNMRFFKMHTLVSSDFVSIDPSLGFELKYARMAFLRLGVNNFQQQEYFGEKEVVFQPNAGIGFKYQGIQIDYALTNVGSENFFSHVISLNVDLDKFFPSKK